MTQSVIRLHPIAAKTPLPAPVSASVSAPAPAEATAIPPHPVLGRMRRPRILISAVRFALPDYRRTPFLRRLIPGETRPERVLPRLIETEARIEETRRAGDAAYSISDHIEVLVALVAESRLIGGDPA